MNLAALVWIGAAFLSGSVPYSLLVGWLAGGGDIRTQGDGNPGATNVGRALGWRWFTLAMLLDGFKGAIPVGLAYYGAHLEGWPLILTAAAPVLGHAFSPWLGLRGGKAVAVTFGVWAGLTLPVAPVLLGMFLTAAYKTVQISGWALMLAFCALGLVVWTIYIPTRPEFGIIWLSHFVILAFKHQADLRKPPGLKPWVRRLLGRL